MKEAEWLASDDPEYMLLALEERLRPRDRKLRLFAVACCRRIGHLMTDERSRRAVNVVERYAEGQATRRELMLARMAARGAGGDYAARAAWSAAGSEGYGAAAGTWTDAVQAAAWADPDANVRAALCAEHEAHAVMLREIIGDPFRPLRPRPEAIAPLAEEIYQGRWELLPILGEWLQENGFWRE